jgi:iron complex outermembrane receptor protein
MKFKTFKIYLTLFSTASTLLGHGPDQEHEALPFYELDPLIIESSPLAPEISDLTQAWCIHAGRELNLIKAQTIGETLAFDTGVAQSYYGPNASRPIIRGLDGPRVRVLQNGLDTFDVSAASVDHAVALDPMLVERIEVLRGSSALLYGASAIGGVVNTMDQTIPRHAYGEPLYGQVRSGYSSVNDGWNTGAVAFVEAGSFVFQVNGTLRETENYDVPRFRLPDGTRTDSVANSDSETWTAGIGGTYLFDNGYTGAAYSHFDTRYGVPNEEGPSIELKRKRFELRSALAPESLDWVDNIEMQFAYGDYIHDEVESSGEIAATFEREGLESRMAFLHSFGELKGVFGFQGNFDTISVSGEENFFAGASSTNPEIEEENAQRLALFVMEEYALSPNVSLNGGVRLESFLRQFKGVDNRDDFTASTSAGIIFKLVEGWSIGGNLNYTEREPETAELFSDGPHLSTGAFELGDPSLEKESAYGVEAILRQTEGDLTGEFAVFYTRFDDFIFLADTGREVDEEGVAVINPLPGEGTLAERVYQGVDAEFYGLEAEVEWSIFEADCWTVDLRSFGDVVWAKNVSDNTDLPRTPPWRIGSGLDIKYRNFSLLMDVTHTGEQKKTAIGEDSTGSFTLLGVRAAYNWKAGYAESELFVRIRNLTDDLARVHTSFLRDTAPLPGRSVDVGLNVWF